MVEQYFLPCVFSALIIFLFFLLFSNKRKTPLPSDVATQKELLVIRRDGRYCPKHLVRYEYYGNGNRCKQCPECELEKENERKEKLARVDELVGLLRDRKKS